MSTYKPPPSPDSQSLHRRNSYNSDDSTNQPDLDQRQRLLSPTDAAADSSGNLPTSQRERAQKIKRKGEYHAIDVKSSDDECGDYTSAAILQPAIATASRKGKERMAINLSHSPSRKFVTTIYLHAAVSERPKDRSDEGNRTDSSESATPPQVQPQTGLDRLRSAGMSPTEISNLRNQFHMLRGTLGMAELDRVRAEEEWMDSLAGNGNGNAGDARVEMTESSLFKELLIGMLYGFFGGVIIIVWLFEKEVFDRKQQIAVICGLLINVSFGVLHSFY